MKWRGKSRSQTYWLPMCRLKNTARYLQPNSFQRVIIYVIKIQTIYFTIILSNHSFAHHYVHINARHDFVTVLSTCATTVIGRLCSNKPLSCWTVGDKCYLLHTIFIWHVCDNYFFRNRFQCCICIVEVFRIHNTQVCLWQTNCAPRFLPPPYDFFLYARFLRVIAWRWIVYNISQ